jgi:flavin reductase (DIM6/NTAB) family NADH-FMN oxidoreductase RutF
MKKSLGAETLAFPTPVWCVGSYDTNGTPNLATVAWGGVCCSQPPCVTISLAKARYSYDNIMHTKAYTVCIPSEEYVKKVDYCGIFSGREMNKFEKAGLIPIQSELTNAPYVAEFPVAIECKVVHIYDLGKHTQFIGQILDVKIDESVLNNNNLPVLEKLKPFAYGPKINTYHGLGKKLGQAFHIGKKL